MRAIDATKREFRKDAEELGHVMGRYKPVPGHGHDGVDYVAECKRCDYSIYLYSDILGASCMHPTDGCMDYQCEHFYASPAKCRRKVHQCTECAYWVPKRAMCPRYAAEGVPESAEGCLDCPNLGEAQCPYFEPEEVSDYVAQAIFTGRKGKVVDSDDELMALMLEGESTY